MACFFVKTAQQRYERSVPVHKIVFIVAGVFHSHKMLPPSKKMRQNSPFFPA